VRDTSFDFGNKATCIVAAQQVLGWVLIITESTLIVKNECKNSFAIVFLNFGGNPVPIKVFTPFYASTF
jgi:hypothetical protein